MVDASSRYQRVSIFSAFRIEGSDSSNVLTLGDGSTSVFGPPSAQAFKGDLRAHGIADAAAAMTLGEIAASRPR